MNKKFDQLLHKYFLDNISELEFKELENLLENNADLRQRYLDYTMMDAGLRSHSQEGMNIVNIQKKRSNPFLWFAAAAAMLICLPAFFFFNSANTIAVIQSSEYAGWESSQATLEGSELHAGTLNLTTGVATLAFNSGADLTLEAPAKIELISAMEVKLISGNMSMYVRESAQGFRVNTPNGYAIDHGTRFSVSISEDKKSADFKVLEGEISLHHELGEVKHLSDAQASQMNASTLADLQDSDLEGFLKNEANSHILSSIGHETSIVFNNQQSRLNQNFLMVKKNKKGDVNRRAFFAFQVDELDLSNIARISLSLNSIPTSLGEVGTMPAESTFHLYGIKDGEDEQWQRTGFLKWADAPKIKKALPLASFKISRANLRTTVRLDSPELLNFIKSNQSSEVGFILACSTLGGTLVHGFASSLNTEASGPRLELIME
ncbi:FecR domain-containing protein [Lentisphaera profundi]|uniref:FecR domain-containing protein n=1 Tax=Lentisphaera profundi TaxID=1658616 RepID=A0ABY7VU73_9BACT|nr:FecR domain-containing protein [Lentisphaera profundi]WDE97309.1 FecR domain-containing protein [Lentisphaera profundi]